MQMVVKKANLCESEKKRRIFSFFFLCSSELLNVCYSNRISVSSVNNFFFYMTIFVLQYVGKGGSVFRLLDMVCSLQYCVIFEALFFKYRLHHIQC